MLQTRSAKRPAQAAVRFAVDAFEERLLDKAEAIATIDADALDALLHPTFDAAARYDRARPRRRGFARRGQGRDRVHRAGGGRAAAADGRDRHPRAAVHRGRRRGRASTPRAGHPHLRGRQGVARRAGRARHGPPGGHRRRATWTSTSRPARCGRRARPARRRPDRDRRHDRRHHADDVPLVDAGGRRPLRDRARAGATSCAQLGVRANADTPEDARRAHRASAPRASGCAGPSTCSWPPTASRRCGR